MRKKFMRHCVPAAGDDVPPTLKSASGMDTVDVHVSPAMSSVVLAVRPSAMGEGIRSVSKGAPSVRLRDGL